MKAIIIPEALLDRIFDEVLARSKVWVQISPNQEALVEHIKVDILLLKDRIKQ